MSGLDIFINGWRIGIFSKEGLGLVWPMTIPMFLDELNYRSGSALIVFDAHLRARQHSPYNICVLKQAEMCDFWLARGF